MEMQARHGDFLLGLAEAQLDAALVRLDGINGVHQPENADEQQSDNDDAAVEAAGHDVLQLVLATPDDLLKVRRAAIAAPAAAGAVRSLPPWPLIVSAAAAPRAAAAVLIAPGHQYLFLCIPLERFRGCGGAPSLVLSISRIVSPRNAR